MRPGGLVAGAAGRGPRDLLPRAAAVGVDAQQHGMVVLDSAGAVIRPRAAFAAGSH